jgi:hypothetical protein
VSQENYPITTPVITGGVTPPGGSATDVLSKQSDDDFDYDWGPIRPDAIGIASTGASVVDDFNNDPAGPWQIRGDVTYFVTHDSKLYAFQESSSGLWGRAPGTPAAGINFKFMFPISGGGSLPVGGIEFDLLIKQSALPGDTAWVSTLDAGVYP